MNIQLIVVAILFAGAVTLTGRRLYISLSRKKTEGCNGCSQASKLNKKA